MRLLGATVEWDCCRGLLRFLLLIDFWILLGFLLEEKSGAASNRKAWLSFHGKNGPQKQSFRILEKLYKLTCPSASPTKNQPTGNPCSWRDLAQRRGGCTCCMQASSLCMGMATLLRDSACQFSGGGDFCHISVRRGLP